MSPRVYLVRDVCEILKMSRRQFFEHRRAGRLPMCEELRPRIGRVLRFRADLVDRYAEGRFGQLRSFSAHRRVS